MSIKSYVSGDVSRSYILGVFSGILPCTVLVRDEDTGPRALIVLLASVFA